MSRLSWRRGAALGALVGLVEAQAIVRYDWIQDDPTPGRLAVALGWAAAIVAVDAAGGALLTLLARGRAWLVALAWSALVIGTRHWTADRYEDDSAACGPLALVLALVVGRWPRLLGALAVALALPALWGRVPIHTTPRADQLALWLPGAALALALSALAGPSPAPPRPPAARSTPLAPVAALLALGVALLAAAAALHPPPARATRDGGPNLLYILVDTLRADHVAPYGRGTPGTAHGAADGTARLAAEGTTFSDAVTVIPKTTQSVAAQQTGRYPVTTGVRVLADPLPADEQTLAELLAARGYATGAVVHNGWIMRGRGYEQGFQQFWSFFEIERAWGPLRLSGLWGAIDALTLRRARAFDGNTDATVATDRAIAWLEEHEGQPFYLYVHYFDPHWPYRPPGVDAECVVNNIREARWSRGQMIFANPLPAKENERAISLYGQEVDHNVDQVGRLLQWLDQAGLAEDTVVVFTADHGHHLGDHDYWYHHGELLYEPGLRIPLILRAPGRLPAGVVDDRPARSIDLLPTLLGLLEVPAPPALDGVDLRRADPGPAFLETDISYFKWNKRRPVPGVVGKVRGLRDGAWKLHYTPTPKAPRFELYDLAQDPEELHDLARAPEARERLDRMVRELAAHVPADERAALAALGNDLGSASGPAPSPQAPGGAPAEAEAGLDANERAMLEALGYVESEH